MIVLELPTILAILGMVGALVLWGFRTLNKYNETNLKTQVALTGLTTSIEGLNETVKNHRESLGEIYITQKKHGEHLSAMVATCKQTHKRNPLS